MNLKFYTELRMVIFRKLITNKLLSFPIIIAQLLCLTAFGQVTIDSCQEKARKNYPQIKQLDFIEQTEIYNLANANKGYLPQFSLSARATYQSDVTEIPESLGLLLSQMSGRAISFTSPNKEQFQIIAEANQMVWDGGLINAQKKNIKCSTEIDKQKLEVDLFALRERITQIYFGILSLNEQLVQIDLLQEELQTNFNKINSYKENGVANQTDLNIMKVEQIKANQKRTEILAMQKSYKAMLAVMTADSAVITGSIIKPITLLPAKESSVINRPEIKLFDAQKNFFTSQNQLIKSSNLPKATLFAQGGYGNPGLNMFTTGFTTYYILGARLSWNFGGFYTQKNNLNKINISKQLVDVQKEVFIYNTQLKLTQTNNEIDKILEQLKSDDEIIKLRTNIKKTAQAKVENGTLTVSDLVREINAENAAIQDKALHEIQLLMAIYNFKFITNN